MYIGIIMNYYRKVSKEEVGLKIYQNFKIKWSESGKISLQTTIAEFPEFEDSENLF